MAGGALALGVGGCGREEVVSPTGCSLWSVVSPAADTVRVGESVRFLGLVGGCVGSRALVWSLSGDSAATITSASDASVVVTGRAKGQATVIATAAANMHVKSGAIIVVLP